MKVFLIKDKKMNAVNINMTLEASNFEKMLWLTRQILYIAKKLLIEARTSEDKLNLDETSTDNE